MSVLFWTATGWYTSHHFSPRSLV